MEFQEFLRQIMDANRFKHGQNIMDRKVKISTYDGDEVEIDSVEVDYQGTLIIHTTEVK